MLTVRLHGRLGHQVAKKYRREGIKLHATRVPEALAAIEQLFPINRDLWLHGAEFRVGRTLKGSRALKLSEITNGHLCGLDGLDAVTLHIVPSITGSEITTAMIITALVSAAISIGVSLLMAALFPPTETKQDKRKSALYASGLNTQTEGARLSYVAGKKVLAGMNLIETDVSILQSGLAPSFSPGPAAILAGASGGLTGAYVYGGNTGLWNEIWTASMGSKGGGKTRSDNMFSYATMKMLGAVGAGQIGGIVGATEEEKEQNIFIAEIPLRDKVTNQRVYEGVLWTERYGVADQATIPIIPGVSNVQDRNVALVNHTIGGSSGAIIDTVTSSLVDRIKLRVNMALVETSKKGNQYDTNMDIAVHTKRDSGTWQQFGTWHWSGKSSSAVQSELIVNAPPKVGDEAWQFKIERLTPDSTSDRLQNDTSFNGWTEVIDQELTYGGSEADGIPPTALFAMSVDAAQFDIQNPPEVVALWQGRLVRVPNGYDPIARTYPTFWDGTWVRAVTDNPVWHWLELATDKLVGGGIDDGYFNKFSLLDCAKFCDQLVNGRPRFTLNKQFTDDQPLDQLLTDLAKTFRANVFFGGDQILLIQDRPQDWINHYINNSMVANGQFTTDSIPPSERFNEVIVEWDNPEDHFRTARVRYRDDAAIARNRALGLPNNGIVSNRVYKIGCTDPQEAYDYARLLVWISQNQAESITFDTLLGHNNYAPGQLVEVDDWYVSGKSKVGRVRFAHDANTFELDAPFTFKANTPYKLHIVKNTDGSAVGQSIRDLTQFTTDTTTSTISLTAHGLSDETPVGIIQVGGGAQPVVYRIIDIIEKGAGQATVTGQVYHAGMFEWVEQNVPVVIPPSTQIKVGVPSPTGFTAVDSHRVDDVLGTIFDIEASWKPYTERAGAVSIYTKVLGYDVRFKAPNDADYRPWRRAYTTFFNVLDAEPGEYLFELRAINTLGATSETVRLSYGLNTDSTLDLEPPVFEGLD